MRRLISVLFVFLIASAVFSVEYSREDMIVVDSSGNALLIREENVHDSALAKLFRIHWEYVEKQSGQQDFFSQISDELKFVLPGNSVWNSVSLNSVNEAFSRSMEGQIESFSLYDKSSDTWSISTGPSEKLMEEYFEFIFSQMMFQTMFLESLEKPSKEFQGEFNDGVISHKKITEVILPEGTEIINADELDGMNWLVDFGGGSKMTASLSLSGNSLVLTEYLYISLSRPGTLIDSRGEFIMSLYNYARFEARYRIAERKTSLPHSLCKEPGPDDWAGNFYQNFSGLELSAEVEIPLNETTSSATPACTIALTVKPSAPLNAHIAWNIDFYWNWWNSSWELDYFEAWIDASPQLEFTLEFETELTFAEIEKTLLSKSYPVAKIAFSIGVVPVYINIVLYGELKTKAKAYGKLTAETGVVVGVNLKAGARYSDGWSDIVEFDPFYTIKPLEIDAEAGATATGKLEVGAHALLYDIAGPYIAVIPSLEAGLKVSVSEGLEPVLMARLSAAAGIDIAGWLKSIIGDIGSVTIEIGNTLEKDLIPEIGDLLDWNRSPSAVAGADFSVNEGEVVSLDGVNSSDPDSDSLSYMWTQISGATVQVQNSNARLATFSAPELPKDSESQLEFKLEINDGRGGSSSDTITVTVLDVNKPPSSNVMDDTAVDEGTTLTFDLNSYVSDPDGDTVTLTKTSGPGEITNGIYIFSPNFTESGSYTVEFSVSDGRGGSIVDQFIVVVNNINRPPVTSFAPQEVGRVGEGTEVAFDGTASSDPDGDQLSYSWSVSPAFQIGASNNSGITFTTQEQPAGEETTYVVTLIVQDTGLMSSTATGSFIVFDINNPPTADGGDDQSVEEGETVNLDGNGSSDPDLGDQLTYSWSSLEGIVPNCMDSTLSFVAPDISWGSSEIYSFLLTVTDLIGATASDTVEVAVSFINSSPSADAGPDREAGSNYPVTFTTGGSFDPDESEGDNLTQYRWDYGDGTYSEWKDISESESIHIYEEYGIYDPTLTVKDTLGATACDSFQLEIKELLLQLDSEEDILDFEETDGVMHNYSLGATLHIESLDCTFTGRDLVYEIPLIRKETIRSNFSGISLQISMDGFNWTTAGSAETSPASIEVGTAARFLRIIPISGRLDSSAVSISYRGSSEEPTSSVDCYSSGPRTHNQHEYSLPEEKVILEYEIEIAGTPASSKSRFPNYLLANSYWLDFERPGAESDLEEREPIILVRNAGDLGAYRREDLFELVEKVVVGEFASSGFSKICFTFAEPIEIEPPDMINDIIESEYGDWYCVDGSITDGLSLVASSSTSPSLTLKLMSSDGTIHESIELNDRFERNFIKSVEGKLYIGIIPEDLLDEAAYSLGISSREIVDIVAGENMQSASLIESSSSVSGELSQETPENWYKFSSEKGQIIELDLQVPVNCRFVLQLKDSRGVTRKSAAGLGEIVSTDYVAGVSGEWFVRVYRSSGAGKYLLNVSVRNQSDAGEVGDSGEATSTSFNLLPGVYTGFLKIDDNSDLYSVEIEKGQIITVDLTTESEGRFYGSFLRENGISYSGSSFSKESPGAIDYCADYTGAIYIKVSRSSGEGEYGLDTALRSQNDGGSGKDAGETAEDSVLIGVGENSGELKYDDNSDFYSLDVSKGQIISVNLTTESEGRFYGSFLRENGISYSGSPFSKESPGAIDYCTNYSGLLYIKVTRSSGEGLYHLDVSVVNQNDGDSGLDAGEEPESATEINMGDVSGRLKHADDEDWYSFSASSGEVITLKSDPVEGLSYNISLVYYSKDRISIANSISINDNSGSIKFCTKTSGKHYLRVSRNSGEGEYTFNIVKAQQNDANTGVDAGDSISNATALPAVTLDSKTYSGFLLNKDNEDWFALGMVPLGTLNITLNSADGRFYLYLYNANKSQVSYSANSGKSQSISYSVTGEVGVWYLKVSRQSGEGNYLLSISRETIIGSIEMEETPIGK